MIINPFIFSNEQFISTRSIAFVRHYGDSITVGQNASVPDESYARQFSLPKGFGITNLAVSGRGTWNQAASINSTGVSNKANTLVTVMAGFNDIRRNGSASKTLKKIEAGYKSFVLKCISDVETPSGDASVTRTGTLFTEYNALSVGGTCGAAEAGLPGPRASFTTTNGDKWTWGFTGTSFAIQLFGNSGDVETYGSVDIKVDGNTVATINLNDWYDNVSDGSYDNRRGPVPFFYFGLANTSHSVEVICNGVGATPVDFFATLKTNPDDCPTILFMEIPYMNATGYAIVPNSASVAISDTASLVIEGIVNLFRGIGYKIAYVTTNEYYDVSTGLDTDNIHPNNTGMDQITAALDANIETGEIPGYTPSTEVQDAIDYATTQGWTIPNDEVLSAIQNYIASEISDGLWAKTDAYWIHGLNYLGFSNFAKINFKNPGSNNLSTSGGVTYTLSGHQGNGTTGYVNTNFNPTTHGVTYLQNSAHRRMYVRSVSVGNALDGTDAANINRMIAANTAGQRINQASNNLNAAMDLSGTGYRALNRSSSSDVQGYVGTTQITRTATSATMDNKSQLLFRNDTNYSNALIPIYAIGGSLTSGEHGDAKTNMETLLTSLGLSL